MTRERPAGVQSPDTDAQTGADTGPVADTAAPEPAADPAPVTLGTALAVPAVTLVTALLLLVGGVAIRVPESSGFLGPQFFPLTVGALLGVTACAAGVRAVLAVRRSPSAGATETPAAPTAPTSPEASGVSAPPESTGTSETTGFPVASTTSGTPTTPGASNSPGASAAPRAAAPNATDDAATGTDPAADPDASAAASDARSEHGDWRTLGIMAATLTAHVLLLQPLGWLLSGTLLFWGVSFALDRRSPLLDLCVAVALAAIVQICFSGLLDVSLPSGLLGKVL